MNNHHEIIKTTDALCYFQSKAESFSSLSSRTNYLKFVTSLRKFVGKDSLEFHEITKEFSDSYRQYLVDKRCSANYINRLGQNFRSLCKAASKDRLMEFDKSVFNWVTSKKPAASEVRKSRHSALCILHKISVLTDCNNRRLATASRMILTAIIAGCRLDQVCKLNVENLPTLAKGYMTDGDYNLTDLALCDCDNWENIKSMFSFIGLTGLNVNNDLICELTAEAMAENGLSALDISSFLPYVPDALLVKYPISGHRLTPEKRMAISQSIANSICDITPYWFVVRMFKPHSIVEAELHACDCVTPMEEYYPLEDLVKRIGKKITRIKSPVIKNTMFIKTTKSDVVEIARKIHGVASVLKSTPDAKSQYARIHQKELNDFRLLVSHGRDFTECGMDTQHFEPETKVSILKDGFEGQNAIVIRRQDDNTYLVRILGTQFRLFTAEIPSQFLKAE